MTIPSHIRPINFAGVELILDLLHYVRGFYGDVDMESLVILLCVSDATMRPFMLDPETPQTTINARTPPNAIRGSISRRLISDKTGLPRETVRRRVAELAKRGLVLIDESDGVQISHGLAKQEAWVAIEQGHRAVLRYLDRLRAFGLDPLSPHPSL